MRGSIGAFWLGVVVTAAVFVAAGGTSFDARVTGGESRIELRQRVDQSLIGGLLGQAAPSVGSLHLTKQTWGILTFYSEQLVVTGARFGEQGLPAVRLAVEIPGTVTSTNASAREGAAFVWATIPAGEPARVETRAVNWPVAVFAAAALAASLWLRRMT